MRDPVPELAGQKVGLPPVGMKKPASAMQSVIVVEAVSEPVPELEGQSMHAAADVVFSLYVPKLHAETVLPRPVYPASARQSINSVEPVSEPVPEWDGQSVHAIFDAAVSLYVPEVHAATELPLPVYPASARQSFSSPEDAGLLLLDGQP